MAWDGKKSDGLPANGLGISGGALIDRYGYRAIPPFKEAPILRARSAVGCIQPLRRA
jgi:hypothetical protein